MRAAVEGAGASTVGARLRYTPLRDLVRGRLTGRLDVAGAISAARLPEPLPGLVTQVVRRTRLRRLERADVAQELIAHFADGIGAGAEASDMAEAFGDPVQAARLIRRAKKRARSRAERIASGVLVAGVALAVVYVGAAMLLRLRHPSPATDYLAVINAPILETADEDRAWPAYRAALIAIDDPQPMFRAFTRPPRPGEDGWDEVAAYLDGQQESLAVVREAAARPALGFELSTRTRDEDLVLWPERAGDEANDDLLLGVLLPYLSKTRMLAKLLALDAWRAAAADDGDAVLANLDAMLGLAAHAREAPFLINDLVAESLATLAVRTAGNVLAMAPTSFDDDQLRRLAHRFAALEDVYAVRLEGERMGFEDVVQHLYTDDGAGDGHITVDGLRLLEGVVGWSTIDRSTSRSDAALVAMSPALVLFMAGRHEVGVAYDQAMARHQRRLAEPLWERRSGADDEPWDDSALTRLRYLPVHVMVPAVEKAALNADLGRLERDGLLAAIAVERYRRVHGDWPERLDALVPDILPAVPVDRFDGRGLRYAVVDGRPRLYSVGSDRDDDGGTAGSATRHRPPWFSADEVDGTRSRTGVRGSIPDGDWVLWPASPAPLERRTG
jgi:hypothetical protein